MQEVHPNTLLVACNTAINLRVEEEYAIPGNAVIVAPEDDDASGFTK